MDDITITQDPIFDKLDELEVEVTSGWESLRYSGTRPIPCVVARPLTIYDDEGHIRGWTVGLYDATDDSPWIGPFHHGAAARYSRRNESPTLVELPNREGWIDFVYRLGYTVAKEDD